MLDEPTSALDPTARAEIIDLLMTIQKQLGTSYLFISHDLSTVRFISHRVAVMYLGMIVEQGDSAELFARPRHPYSVGLLSSVLLPNPRLKRQTSVSLKGEIPSPINLPTGCFLASRCPFVDDRCRSPHAGGRGRRRRPSRALLQARGGGRGRPVDRHLRGVSARRRTDPWRRLSRPAATAAQRSVG